MESKWKKLIFDLDKKYSIPILFLLYSEKELSFDQIYEFCSRYKSGPRSQGGTLRDRGKPYKAISRESISRATAELQGKKYVKKTAKLNKNGRPYAVYTLTDEARQIMGKHLTD